MKCRNAKKLIFEFIDGLEDDTNRLALDRHLAGCPECDKLASQLTRSMDLIHRAPVEATDDNFAWKVRLKLNQERNSVAERGASYGTLIRSWNVRYSATAVAAAAVVLVAGMLAVKSGMTPVIPNTVERANPTVAKTPDETPTPVRVDDPGEVTVVQPPRRGFRGNMPGRSTGSHLVGDGAPAGEIIGVDLIDRTSPMSVAEMDSLMNTQLDGLAPSERLRHLSQYMYVLQRQMLRAQVMNRSNR